MKKMFVIAALVVVILSACGTPPTAAPTAVPPTAVATAVPPPTAIPPTPTPQPPVDDNTWYQMYPKSKADMAVDIWNDGNNGVALVAPGDYSGQYWRFMPQSDGTYKITNQFLQDKNLVFDLFVEGKNTRVFMAALKDSKSQNWTVTKLGGDTYRLVNVSLGDGFSLDINSSNKLVLVENSTSDGQIWFLKPLGNIK
jgi:hypothetical protein